MASSQVRVDEVAQIIREMDAEFVRNLRARNAEALVEGFYADDARLLAPGHPMITGKAAITQVWEAVLQSGVTALTLDTQIIDSRDDVAYGIGQFNMTTAASGQVPTEMQGKYVVIYKRQPDGRWRAIVDIYNGDR